jgi:hypothetical protein
MKDFLPYDIYERHRKVGSLIAENDTVLDVGGELNQLSRFCPASKIVVANLKESQEKSDVTIEKGKLPFKPLSFSVVCAIDVLEHIPKAQRKNFIADIIRVSSKNVILSFPVGTKTHIEYEKEISEWLKSIGQDVTYLEEHIMYGLPDKKEIEDFTKGRKKDVSYSGSLIINRKLFKIYMFDPKIKVVRKLVYILKHLFNFLTNRVLYALLSNKEYSENIVRAYVLIKK